MMLLAGTSRQEVARDIWQSAEHRGIEVDQIYQTYLHRNADPVGRAAWVNAFLAGATEVSVVEMILNSAEYQSTHQSDLSFVTGLYVDVLGRAPDAGGLAIWQQALQNGVSRSAVAEAFLTSGEADRDLVDRFYAEFLQRNADAAGEQGFVRALQNRQLSPEAVAEIFLASNEYFSKP
jgi:SOS response regulatory protein OraA/RecX